MRGIYRFVAVLLLLLMPAAGFAKAPPKEKPQKSFQKSEELLKWINSYRLKPEPRRLAIAVQSMSALGLTKDMDQAGLYIGFTAGVIGSNPDLAEDLVAKMFPLPPEDQVLVIKAVAYSGLPDWQGLLTKFVERMPARKILIDKFLYGKKPVLADVSMKDDNSIIDVNWGYYFATGSEAPIRRIVGALSWSVDKNNVEQLTTGSMVKWTLAQNAAHDPDLLSMLKSLSTEVDPKARPPLAEVIDAAETLELAKLRKDALASIDELKTKGPENVRNYNWWGQAGQTVFALGCVAAGVTGHIELGIPCVLGGAASTAALKYLGPSQ